MESKANQKFVTGHKEYVSDCCFDFYGKRLATASADGFIRIWACISEKWMMQSEIEVHNSLILRVDWAHPLFGNIIAACLYNFGVLIYEEICVSGNKKQWVKRSDLCNMTKLPMDIAFCPIHWGLKLAICSINGSVYLNEPNSLSNMLNWTCVSQFSCTGQARSLSWGKSKDHGMSICVGTDKDAQVWEVDPTDVKDQWKRKCSLTGHGDLVHNVAWANDLYSDRQRIATACADGFLRIFEIEGEIVHEVARINCQNQEVWRLEWNVAGTILVSTGDDDVIRWYKQAQNGVWACISEASKST